MKHLWGVSEWTDGQMDGWIHFPLLLGPGWPGSPGSMFPPGPGPAEQTPRHAYPFSWPQMPGVIICGLAWPAGPAGSRPPPSPPNPSDRTGFQQPRRCPLPRSTCNENDSFWSCPTLSVCPKGSERTCPGTSHPSPSLVPSEACSTLGATHPWPGFKELHPLQLGIQRVPFPVLGIGAQKGPPGPARRTHIWGKSHWAPVAGAPLPCCDPAGRHLLSLGTNGIRRLFTFTWAGWIRHLPGGARLPTHGRS